MRQPDEPKPRVPAEKVEAELEQFLDAVLEDADRQGYDRDSAPPEIARARELALASMRRLFESEIHVAVPFDEHQGIDQAEREREIAKAALSRLKLKQLARIAENFGLRRSGSRLDLLDRIIMHLGTDEQEIARLVMKYGDASATGRRRHLTRLMPLEETATPQALAKSFDDLVGRYLRTGIAEWFVFTEVLQKQQDVYVQGVLRSYDVEAASLLVDSDGKYALRTDERDDDVLINFRHDQPLLRVQARGLNESRAALRAFRFASGLRAGERLVPSPPYDLGKSVTTAARSAWFLALTKRLLSEPEIPLLTVTSVTFERDRKAKPTTPHTPRIESSRFKGHHVLDTPQICRYIADGHLLSGVAFTVHHADNDGVGHALTARVSMEDGTIAVSTQFGTAGPEGASKAHASLEELCARSAMVWPLPKEKTLEMLKDVQERAREKRAPSRATLFAPAGAVGPVDAHAVN